MMSTLSEILRIRDSNDRDHEFKHALYAATRDDLRQLIMPVEYIDKLIAMQQQIHEAGQRGAYPQAEHWILEHLGVPIGRLVVDAGGKDWRVVDLAVLPAGRRQGHASALLRALQRRATVQQARIGLAVRHSNHAARQLYMALGFRQCGADALHEQMRWSAPASALLSQEIP